MYREALSDALEMMCVHPEERYQMGITGKKRVELYFSLLVSLSVTSWFNMVTTRYISDMLYEEKPEKIMPSLYGSCSVMLAVGGILYAVFLHFSGVKFTSFPRNAPVYKPERCLR